MRCHPWGLAVQLYAQNVAISTAPRLKPTTIFYLVFDIVFFKPRIKCMDHQRNEGMDLELESLPRLEELDCSWPASMQMKGRPPATEQSRASPEEPLCKALGRRGHRWGGQPLSVVPRMAPIPPRRPRLSPEGQWQRRRSALLAWPLSLLGFREGLPLGSACICWSQIKASGV